MKYEDIRSIMVLTVMALSGWWCSTNVYAYIIVLISAVGFTAVAFIPEDELRIRPIHPVVDIVRKILAVIFITGVYYSGQYFLATFLALAILAVGIRMHLLRKER